MSSVTKIVLAGLALPAFLAACASTDTAKDSSSQSSASSSQPSASASGTQGSNPSGSGMNSSSAAARMPSQRSVYYEFDKSDIKPDQRSRIEANAKYLRDNPGAKATVEGNCDERGSREYNLALGQRRSEGVVKMMSLLGARSSQMEAVSFGSEKPKVQGHDEGSWAENRRSDIQYR
jgi:peptidoglycan-associated lipoprotein